MKHIKLFETFVNENTRKEAEKIADQITDGIRDMINNNEDIDSAYYLVKDYFEGDTRNPLFDMVVDLVSKWMKKNRVNEAIELIALYSPVEFAREWSAAYGEDLQQEYSDLYKELLKMKMFTVEDLARLWKKLYGKDFKKEHTALYKKLDK